MFFSLYKIGRIRKYLDKTSTERLVHAFVTSRLDGNNGILYGLPAKTIAPQELSVANANATTLPPSSRISIGYPLHAGSNSKSCYFVLNPWEVCLQGTSSHCWGWGLVSALPGCPAPSALSLADQKPNMEIGLLQLLPLHSGTSCRATSRQQTQLITSKHFLSHGCFKPISMIY